MRPSSTIIEPPTIRMLIDRTSFDETDDFSIDEQALQTYDEQPLVSGGPIVMKNGKIRRRMRWRGPKTRRLPSSSSNASITSEQSRRSVHSFASTETQQKNNTSRHQQRRRLLPLSSPSKRPNYTDRYLPTTTSQTSEQTTIATEGTLLYDPYRSPLEEDAVPIPSLHAAEGDRRVDLRIARCRRPPKPTAAVLKNVDFSFENDERSVENITKFHSHDLSTPDTASVTDNENEDDEERFDDQSSSLDEIRFSMANHLEFEMPRYYQEVLTNGPTSSHSSSSSQPVKSKTGPVDLDDGQFLEVEKNLQAIHDMATEHLDQNEYEEALEVFEEILRGQWTRYGEDHFRVGTAHHNIGIVHARMRNYDQAVESYTEAIRIRKATLGECHADVAVSLAQLGVAHLEMRKHRKALLAFRESLKIRRQLYGNVHPKVAKILNNIGCALYELDELEVATVAFEEALQIQRLVLKSTPTEHLELSQVQLLGIASTQSNLASIQLLEGEYEGAAVQLEEVLLVQECVLSEHHPLVRQTRESLVWIEQQCYGTTKDVVVEHRQAYLPDVMMDIERRLTAMRDLACGSNDEGSVILPGDASEESSSIAGS